MFYLWFILEKLSLLTEQRFACACPEIIRLQAKQAERRLRKERHPKVSGEGVASYGGLPSFHLTREMFLNINKQ